MASTSNNRNFQLNLRHQDNILDQDFDDQKSPLISISSEDLDSSDSGNSQRGSHNHKPSPVKPEQPKRQLDPKEQFERNYAMLKLGVESIKPAFNKILNKHEKDFINAYHSYMEKVQKELAFWQKRMNETYGKMVNDDQVASLQHVINLFIAESENINGTLEQQKEVFQGLKEERQQGKQERKEQKDELRRQMRENKELQIVTNKVESKNEALKKFIALNNIGTTATSSQSDKPYQLVNIKFDKNISQHPSQEDQSNTSKNQGLQQEPQLGKVSTLSIFNKPLNQDIRHHIQKKTVSEYVLSLFNQELSNQEIEQKVSDYFKKKEKKKDKTIQIQHRRLDSLRKFNYKARGSQAHGISEKAEVENLFLECIEEYKKDVKKRHQSQLAINATLQRDDIQVEKSPLTVKRLSSQIIIDNKNKTLDKVVTRVTLLSQVFDQMFGKGGYSGVAFQEFLQNVRTSQSGIGTAAGVFNIENMSVLSQPSQFNDISEKSEYSERPTSQQTGIRSQNKQQLDNLINLQKRTKQLHQKNPSSFKGDSTTVLTNYTSQHHGNTFKGQKMSHGGPTGQEYASEFSSPIGFKNHDRAATAVDFYKHMPSTANSHQQRQHLPIFDSNLNASHVRNNSNIRTVQYNPPPSAPGASTGYIQQQPRSLLGTGHGKRTQSISLTSGKHASTASVRKPLTIRNGKLMINSFLQ
ncbi:hypothetical protein FGO68_gene217 [Halteria grandinella]|uniref:Uncharacterized protein n=1 Tax=Halteria grandinella TaxID=5974 RepID=A0A8J8P1F7_HALGN|nr:hypothetical protein FGO68_gene217 [Halteria grandinella]